MLTMTEKPQLFLLVDGYSLLFRAYMSMGPMNAPDGTPTNALFGLLLMLFKVLEDYKPDYVIVAFDAHAPTFRHKEFPAYKAHRDKAEEHLLTQMPIARELVDALGLDRMEMEGFEADDVIGTMARKGEKLGWDVNILTGDSDLAQLASKHITIIQMLRGVTETRTMDPDFVRERYGIAEPEYLVDYKGLVGDPSDNIPGVKGVGEKTAKTLLAKWPTIDDIFINLDKIDEKIRKKLEGAEDTAKFSRYLATIKTDLPLEIDESSAEHFKYDFGHIDREKAARLFIRLGFKSMLDRLNLSADIPVDISEPSSPAIKWEVIFTESALNKIIGEIKNRKRFALDFETDSLDTQRVNLVGVAVAIDGKTGYYIPVGHEIGIGDDYTNQLPLKKVIEEFKPIWEDAKIEKVCQNGKFEWLVCHKYGVSLNGLTDDPMVADYIINPDNRHGLKEMAFRELGWQMTPIEELIGKRGKKQSSMDKVAIDKAAPYAAADATSTWLLAEKFAPILKKEGLEKLYRDTEMPLVTVLAEMEARGIKLNADVLREISGDLGRRIDDISKVIFQSIGKEINLNSPKQLAELLFDQLKLPQVRKRSTDAEVLEKLKNVHELPQMILEYRSLAKLKGTYTENLIELIDPRDGRLHTSYNQTITSTGRLSSSDPNLQNIPMRTDLGREIRKAFEPNDKDDVLLSADYSQIELRLLTHFSEDPVLINAFENDEDIHRRTAMEVFSVPADKVTPDMRRSAKVINFGIIYGMGPDGLSNALGKSRTECKAFIDRFFDRYPNVKSYMDKNLAFGREKGYVETLLGRRKYYSELESRNRMARAAAERAAVNMPLQGSAADIIKLAMVELSGKMVNANLPDAILLQVHDELVLSVPKGRLNEIAELVGKTMAKVR
ncbi:MAG: DNA polymerase I, partial [bacterium]